MSPALARVTLVRLLTVRVKEGEKERFRHTKAKFIASVTVGLHLCFSLYVRFLSGEGVESVWGSKLTAQQFLSLSEHVRGAVRRAKLYYLRGTFR